jgi:23S rRNA G2445 N2-methylase RlmL
MTRYFSAFASGFEKLAARFLAADLPGAANIKIYDGALAYNADAAPDEIRAIKYFKNSFIILQTFSGIKSVGEMASLASAENIRPPKFARSFRVVFSDKNELAAIDGSAKAGLIDAIRKRISIPYRSGAADVEFLLALRNDGDGFFLRRITRGGGATDAGELEPHIAAMLCRAGSTGADDIFIDPFCGRGAIPLARAQAGPYRGIFAADMDERLTAALRLKIRGIKNSKIQKSFFVKTGDFLQNRFDDNFADAIATDPPWGAHQKISADFYPRVMDEFARILKPGGRLALLTARELALPRNPKLAQKESFNVLIHGKKATLRTYLAE